MMMQDTGYFKTVVLAIFIHALCLTSAKAETSNRENIQAGQVAQSGRQSAGSKMKTSEAVFAGGCFWCMQPPFEKLEGVLKVEAGYAGGTGENPTYEDYAQKGYVEAVRVTFNPSQIIYQKLLDVFWRQINPTDSGGQFCDRGHQYTSAIYYFNDEQKQWAEESKAALTKSGRFKKPIITSILPYSIFYPAETYHQDYYKKHSFKYKIYRFNCGRDQYLDRIWGSEAAHVDPPAEKTEYKHYSQSELKKMLSPLQYRVTQENGTEPAFKNLYWDNQREGIYVDIISGEPLFSSTDKFDSGTGWPSFTKPLDPNNIVEKEEKGLFSTRIEVRSKHSDSHLGDLFHDGPPPTGLRYCINSAALRFIPKADLVKDGYGRYLKIFEKKDGKDQTPSSGLK